MKLYNRELEEINNPKRKERMETIVREQITFLSSKFKIDETYLQNMASKLSIVERKPSNPSYLVEYKGEKQEIANKKMAAAFAAIVKQNFDGEQWTFENGIYMDDSNNTHNIIHELFHFFSIKQRMDFDENGIGYTKMGVSITSYDKEDHVVNDSLRAVGLNEGITELFATMMDEGCSPQAYYFQTYIANILINDEHNLLTRAYFSEDKKDFENFLKDFDSKQTSVSSQKLITMSTNVQEPASSNLLKGCLEYAFSFCQNMEELKKERNRILPILKEMSKNPNIEFDNEQFDISQLFKDTLQKKKEEFEKRKETSSSLKNVNRNDEGEIE